MIDESNDPDINFFSDKSEALDSPYCSIDESNSSPQELLKNMLSILYRNIRNLNKSFEKSREYLSIVKRNFNVAAFIESWCNDNKAAQNFLLQLPNYAPIHQVRNNGQRGRSVELYVHSNLNFKIPEKQSININDIECAYIKVIRKNAKNIIVSCIYQPPRGYFHKFLHKIKAFI